MADVSRVLVAPDKFAGTLTAVEAARAVATGWRRADPDAEIDEAPMADGGPGFVAVLHASLGGAQMPVRVRGPLGEPTEAIVLVAGQVAYVEAAQACGLHLVTPTPETAVASTTHGVGDLVLAAAATGVREVVVGVGGTATTDGGRGCVEVVGDRWPPGIGLVAATDVRTPLLGRGGAAAVFGPQKGADGDTVDRLERRLAAWVASLSSATATATAMAAAAAPGTGAGGGLAYGLTLLGGTIRGGFATVANAVGLDRRVGASTLVVTGEGRVDRSSLAGKVVSGVGSAARRAGVPCLALAGDVSDDVAGTLAAADLESAGVGHVHTLVAAFGREAALAHPWERLADLAARVARGTGARPG